MTRTCCFLAAAALLLAAGTALATDRREQDTQGSNVTEPPPRAVRSGGRWAAAVDRRGDTTGLLITDLQTGQTWRLADFEAIGVLGAHWLGADSLEVDFAETTALLRVLAPREGGQPTFHLVTTEFNVQGAGRVDYFSPPLAARFDPTQPVLEPGG